MAPLVAEHFPGVDAIPISQVRTNPVVPHAYALDPSGGMDNPGNDGEPRKEFLALVRAALEPKPFSILGGVEDAPGYTGRLQIIFSSAFTQASGMLPAARRPSHSSGSLAAQSAFYSPAKYS